MHTEYEQIGHHKYDADHTMSNPPFAVARAGSNGTWHIVSEAAYVNWSPGEPNDWREGEDCAEMWQDGKWKDLLQL